MYANFDNLSDSQIAKPPVSAAENNLPTSQVNPYPKSFPANLKHDWEPDFSEGEPPKDSTECGLCGHEHNDIPAEGILDRDQTEQPKATEADSAGNQSEPVRTPEGWHVATGKHPEHPPVWIDRVCAICGQRKLGTRQNFGETFLGRHKVNVRLPLPSTTVIETKDGPQTVTMNEFRKMRRYMQTQRLPVVRGCVHKLDINREPKRNCLTCWIAFFNSHGELCQALDEAFHQERGADIIIALKGKKFFTRWLGFMAALALQLKQKQENNVESTGSTSVSGEATDAGAGNTEAVSNESATLDRGQVEGAEGSREAA